MTTLCLRRFRQPVPHRQVGAALIVALLFLVMLTLIGVSAMTTTTLEEKMAGNMRDYNVALQSGEAALLDAWDDINSTRISGMTGFDIACSNGLCARAANSSIPVWSGLDWSPSGPSVEYGSQTGAAALPVGTAGASALPRYILEVLEDPKSSLRMEEKKYLYYRTTARGFGTSDTAQATVQATYRLRR